MYHKAAVGALREEIHSADERSLEEFIGLVDGSLTSVQVMNYLELVTRSLNESHAVNTDLVKRLGTLADVVYKLADRVGKLKENGFRHTNSE